LFWVPVGTDLIPHLVTACGSRGSTAVMPSPGGRLSGFPMVCGRSRLTLVAVISYGCDRLLCLISERQ
jgi:hypothetical protein